jgi:DNA-binding transcriptional regulator YiaG
MNPPLPHWERCESVEEVRIPSADGASPPTILNVAVPAWRDPDDGEIYLDGEAIRILDDARARHHGLMTTGEIRELRQKLGLTQKRLSELLQIGEKTWTRWESGRDRPSKSLHVLICSLRDGRIDVAYLEGLLSGTAAPLPAWRQVSVQSAADVRWSDLLAGIKWETGGETEKETTAAYGDETARWIKNRVTDSAFIYKTGEWKHSETPDHSNNIIPFQKAS